MMRCKVLCLSVAFAWALAWTGPGVQASQLDPLVSKHAAAYGVPESLVRRVIHIESKGNPRVVSKGNYGLMQIRLGTARAMGYRGGAEGLLDADTNMTYAVKYLAGAYRAARGNHEQAIRNYQKGYYYQAKQQGFSPYTLASTAQAPVTQQAAAPVPAMVQEEAVRRQAAELQREAALQARVEQQRAAEVAREARRQALEQERVLRQQAIEQQRAAQRAAAERERAARVAAIESRRQAQRDAAERRRIEQQQAREQRRAEQLQRAQASRAPTPAPSNANASALRAAPAQSYSWYNPMRYFKHPSHQYHPYRQAER